MPPKNKLIAVQVRHPGLHRKDGGLELQCLHIRDWMAAGSIQWTQQRNQGLNILFKNYTKQQYTIQITAQTCQSHI